jgi:hypothetical protein
LDPFRWSLWNLGPLRKIGNSEELTNSRCRLAGGGGDHELEREMVEGRAQVVDAVPNQDVPFWARFLDVLHDEDWPPLLVHLKDWGVGVWISQKPGYRLGQRFEVILRAL